MTTDATESGTRPGGTTKRRDLLAGALAVFAADGYSRATVDEIARRAGVSSRTIYNQFSGKAALFQAVIVDSARHVAEAQIATVRQHLGSVEDLKESLIAFGRAWADPDARFDHHFALVRQVNAEIRHVPPAAIRAWQDAGPRRVRAEIASHLRRLADRGLLLIEDGDVAAAHLVVLTTAEVLNRRLLDPTPPSEHDVRRLADAGVRTFLSGYAPP